MNFSIYVRLLIAMIFKKVKMKNTYKHLDIITEKEWMYRLQNGTYTEVAGFPFPNYSDYYALTVEGKSQLFVFESKVITWAISISALIVSVIALWRTY
ncbi:hypothetical protein [Listeria fleischmannii]|uniref:hypothetical protein n=1 Tax=Listeria fleischmannii TaxID=1069827 RepID=UPI0016266B45|nr:hypothetical protein [Listeria fleischmannii]MBC1420180.1 hypothetical protein [Listeria fleischmannii]